MQIKRIVAVLLGMGLVAQGVHAGTGEFEDLFEDKDFSKWTKVDGSPVGKGWRIQKNGVVVRHGKDAGSINTKEHYRDFELVFDWKISEGGNSGVKYLVKGSLGLEYQVLDDAKHKDGKIPSHRSASIYELVAAPDDKPVKPVGKWNSARVVVKDNHVEHWLNGVKVAELVIGSADWKKRFEASKYKKHEGFGFWTGPIHLQDHQDVVWFRNVKIRKL